MIKTKKVFCFILPSLFMERKGGSELQVYYIAMELIRRGWEVHYIREENDWIGKELIIDGITLYALHRREDYLRFMNGFHLKQVMQRIKADVWYCRATTNYVAPIAWAARKIGGQVVWACSHDFQVSKNLLRKVITSPLKFFFFSIFALLNRFFFSRSLKYIDHVILQSEIQNRLLNTNYNGDGTIINNAHPIPVLPDIKRKKLILWAARLHEWKHPEIFIKIAKKFKLQDYQFIIAGRPMSNSIITLKEIVDAGKNLPNFDYIGEVDSEQIHSLMQQSMLFVSTSSNEGFPNTFIEAWLRGVPVVSLKVDPDSYIKKFNMGRVSENIEQMCHDINQLMTEPELWKEISKNCLKISRMAFNIETHVDKLEHLINSTHT